MIYLFIDLFFDAPILRGVCIYRSENLICIKFTLHTCTVMVLFENLLCVN